jgi:hypothetical protein
VATSLRTLLASIVVVLLARFGTPFTSLAEGETEEDQCVRLIANVGEKHNTSLKTIMARLNAVSQFRLVKGSFDALFAPSGAPYARVDASLESPVVHGARSSIGELMVGGARIGLVLATLVPDSAHWHRKSVHAISSCLNSRSLQVT